MKRTILLSLSVLFVLLIVSCGNHKKQISANSTSDTTKNSVKANSTDIDKTKQELLNKDIEFSNYSEKKGMKDAFMDYIAVDGVFLRPNHKPFVGKDSVFLFLNRKRFKNTSMKWTPMFADVAMSGEMGYTYGTYQLVSPGMNGEMITTQGTYVTIWKKDKDGEWKLVLDSGNDGLVPLRRNK